MSLDSSTERTLPRLRDEGGVALILTLVLLIGLVAISAGALILTGTEGQLRAFSKEQVNLRYLAEQGVEMGLSRINRDETALPDTGYALLENGFQPVDAAGQTLSGLDLNVYVARTGSATGSTGNFASIVGEASGYGTKWIVRMEVTEESFAKYAYFTDNEGSNIWFAGGDEIFGPVHSNDQIKIHSSGAWFHEEVTTGRDILYPSNGTFDRGYMEYVDTIPLPNNTDLVKLAALATAGHTHFTPPSTGQPDNVQMRIEFVTIDVNGDGDAVDDDEGLFRIYRSDDPVWVGSYDGGGGGTGPWIRTCGDVHDHPVTGNPWFISAQNHVDLFNSGSAHGATTAAWEGYAPLRHGSGTNATTYQRSVAQPTSRCLLGGDPRLTPDNATWDFWDLTPGDEGWLRRADFMPGATLPAVAAARADADYLFPLHLNYNPDFRGVMFFDGLIGVSGTLNGRVTLVTSDNITLLDDFTYSVPANAAKCNDIAGFITARNFYIANNNLNAPQRLPSWAGTYRTYDDTGSEFIDGVILAIGTSFTVEEYNQGPTNAQACESTPWGRGCIYLTGGIIQDIRGAVGLTSGRGYLKRYAYDANARFCPPPHFPTTGKFSKNRYFQVSPEAFSKPGVFFANLK